MNKSGKFAVTVAPLAAPIVFMALGFIFGEDNTPKQEFSGPASWPYYPFIFLIVSMLSYFSTIIFGIPLVSLLKRIDKHSLWPILLCSLPIGAITYTIFVYFLGQDETELLIPLLIFASFGAVSAAAVSFTYCWFVGITKRGK